MGMQSVSDLAGWDDNAEEAPPGLLLYPLANGDHWYIDVVRVLVVAGSFWLIVLTLRVAWQRWRDPDPTAGLFGHPLMLVSYALLLVDIVIRRFQYLDAHYPPDLFLLLAFGAVMTGMWATLARIHLKRKPTVWRRTGRDTGV